MARYGMQIRYIIKLLKESPMTIPEILEALPPELKPKSNDPYNVILTQLHKLRRKGCVIRNGEKWKLISLDRAQKLGLDGEFYEEQSEKQILLHDHLVDKYASFIESKGWSVDKNVSVNGLKIDMLCIYKDKIDMIVEVKSAINTGTLFGAIGQLFVYKAAFERIYQRKTILMAVFPYEDFTDFYADVFRRCGIGLSLVYSKKIVEVLEPKLTLAKADITIPASHPSLIDETLSLLKIQI